MNELINEWVNGIIFIYAEWCKHTGKELFYMLVTCKPMLVGGKVFIYVFILCIYVCIYVFSV